MGREVPRSLEGTWGSPAPGAAAPRGLTRRAGAARRTLNEKIAATPLGGCPPLRARPAPLPAAARAPSGSEALLKGKRVASTEEPRGSALRSPLSSVLTTQQRSPTLPGWAAKGITRSKTQYAGFLRGRWICSSQPSSCTMSPAKEDQLVAMANDALSFPHIQPKQLGSGMVVVLKGLEESISRTAAGEPKVDSSMVRAVT